MSDLPPDTVLLRAFEDASQSGVSQLAAQLNNDRFETRTLSGEGGAKQIFKVTDTVTGRSLALARPRGDSPFEHEFLLREARLHAKLEHPNIIRLYDIGLDESVTESGRVNTPYFTMKFVDGYTLKSYVQGQAKGESSKEQLKTRLNDRLDLFLKICDAISYAHDKGICHLDLKPANIFISHHHEVLVGDWGLAREVGQSQQPDLGEPVTDSHQQSNQPAYTLQGTISGTPGYMSPEQCDKQTEIGQASDIYSLGAIFYFLFFGEPPVLGSVMERLQATSQGRLTIPRDKLISGDYDKSKCQLPLPGSLAHVLAKALARVAADRYQSVTQLREDIRHFQLGYMTSVEPAAPGKQFSLFVRRHPVLSAMTLIFFAVISVGTGLYISGIKSSEAKTKSALTQLQQAVEEKQRVTQKRAQDAYQRAWDIYRSHTLGRLDFNERDLSLARSEIELALTLDEGTYQLWLLKGRLAVLKDDFKAAEAAFIHATKKGTGDKQAAANLKVTREILELESIEPAQVFSLLKTCEDNRLIQLYIYRQTFTITNQVAQAAFAHLALLWMNDLSVMHFKFDKESRLLDLSGNPELKNLYPIRKMRIRRLDISGCTGIETYTFVADLPIYRLYAAASNIDNKTIRYLEHKRIVDLNIAGCQVTRTHPLIGMPLQTLDIRGTPPEILGHLNKLTDRIVIQCSKYHELEINEINQRYRKKWRINVVDEKAQFVSAPAP